MIQIMTKVFTTSLNLNIRHPTKTSYLRTLTKDAESNNQVSLMAPFIKPPDLGKLYQLSYYLKQLIGEIWTAETICPGPKISIFPDIADHAGPRVQQVLSLIDSIFWINFKTLLQLDWAPKQLSIAKQEEAVTVETLLRYTSMHSTLESLTAPASNILHTTFLNVNALTLICAETVSLQLPLLVTMVFQIAHQ